MLRNAICLTSRSLLRVSGNEAEPFLQGLITKDVSCVHIHEAIYTFLLNARGRIFADLLIYKWLDELLLETDASRINALEKTLNIYKLRKEVDISFAKDFSVYFSNELPPPSTESMMSFQDPRVSSFGYRIIVGGNSTPTSNFSENDYILKRLQWGIGEGFSEVGDRFPLQMNGDIMDGISFAKGCYIGQELIARTHHTGMIRRRVLPITSSQENVQICGKTLLDENNMRQGKILRTQNSKGIALVSLSHIGKTLFDELRNPIEIHRPHWWPEKLT